MFPTKITPPQKAEMAAMRKQGMTYREIAQHFSVTENRVWQILTRRTTITERHRIDCYIFPNIAKWIYGIIRIVTDRRKQESDMCIITPVRLDHIDKSSAQGITELIELCPDSPVLMCKSAACSIVIYPDRIHILRSSFRSQESTFGVLCQKCLRKGSVSNRADDHGKYHQHQNHSENNSKCRMLSQFFHEDISFIIKNWTVAFLSQFSFQSFAAI